MEQSADKKWPTALANILLSAIASIILSACTSVVPKPFADFDDSSGKLENSSESAIETLLSDTRGMRVNTLSKQSTANLGEPREEASSAYELAVKANEILPRFNEAFKSYSEFLKKLADAKFASDEEIDFATQEINKSFEEAAKASQPDTDFSIPPVIFSASSIEEAKDCMRTKLQSSMKNMLEGNEAAFLQFCGICSKISGGLEAALRNEHGDIAEVLSAKWEKSSDSEERKLAIEELMRQKELGGRMSEIAALLARSYDKLGKTHKSLRLSLENKAFYYEELHSLNGDLKRISKLCSSIRY